MADSLLTELDNYDGEIPAELLEELDREIARNTEANRIAKEKEKQAREAKERFAFSYHIHAFKSLNILIGLFDHKK